VETIRDKPNGDTSRLTFGFQLTRIELYMRRSKSATGVLGDTLSAR
jgi:hypothetical protein